LAAGQTIVPKAPNLRDRTGQILSDGRIDVDGQVFDTPSGAGYYLRKKSTNGWGFWLVDPKTKKSFASVRREYIEKASLEANAIDDEDEDVGDDANDFQK